MLGTPASQTRFDEARKLLEYGFANYQLNQVGKQGDLTGLTVPVRYGSQETVQVAMGEEIALLLSKGQERDLRIEATLTERVTAPVAKGDVLGELAVLRGDERLMTVPAVAASDVNLPGYLEALFRIVRNWKK